MELPVTKFSQVTSQNERARSAALPAGSFSPKVGDYQPPPPASLAPPLCSMHSSEIVVPAGGPEPPNLMACGQPPVLAEPDT